MCHPQPWTNRRAIIRPIAHWWRFKIWQQASTPGDSANRGTDAHYQCLHSHTSNTSTQHSSIYGKPSTHKDTSSKWLHPASPQIKTIIWCCFAGVDAVMLRSAEKADKRRRMVWSWISFKLCPGWDQRVLMFRHEAGVAPPALALIGQYQASRVKNRTHSIPCDTCFWHQTAEIRTSCQAAQTLHTGRSSRTLYRCWHAARKLTLGRLSVRWA